MDVSLELSYRAVGLFRPQDIRSSVYSDKLTVTKITVTHPVTVTQPVLCYTCVTPALNLCIVRQNTLCNTVPNTDT